MKKNVMLLVFCAAFLNVCHGAGYVSEKSTVAAVNQSKNRKTAAAEKNRTKKREDGKTGEKKSRMREDPLMR